MKRARSSGVLMLLVGALLPLVWGPSRVAGEPLIAPEEMLSINQVHPGMKGYGKSVFQGTKIETFHVTVLGVLRKMDFDGDMILIHIDDGAPVTSGAGVSAGMSGSPIYVNDKLIGALAFAWPYAKEPIAGVTPIAQMLENYQPGSVPPPATVAMRGGDLKPDGGPLLLDGRLFARATVVPERGLIPAAAGGTMFLTPVATPVMVSGMGRAGIEALTHKFSRFSTMFAPGPGQTDLPVAERPKIEPGAAVGVELLGGDIDATAIGTVTYVKGNHVVAFGHPMFGLGAIDMPMTTCFIHGVIPSAEVSFKMGSPVETVGHITQDRNWSIGGRTGEAARSVKAEFAIEDRDRGVKRDYHVVAAVQRDVTPMLLYNALLSAVKSVNPSETGTTHGLVEVWPHGMEPIRRENFFAMGEQRSQLEQLFGDPMAGLPMVELLQIMDTLENNPFGTVAVDRVKVTVDVSEKKQTATIERAYADRKQVRPGDKVKIGVVILPQDAPREVREFDVEIPRNIPGGKVQIGVAAGSSVDRVRQAMQLTRPPAKSLAQLLAQVAGREQNNEISIEVAEPVVGISVAGREFPNLPNVVVEVLTGANPSGIRLIRSHSRQTFTTPWVLSGAQVLTLDVQSDEKDKAGPSLVPGGGGFGGFGSILDILRAGLTGDMGGDPGDAGDNSASGGDDQTAARAFRSLVEAAAKKAPPSTDAPNDPTMPAFSELQSALQNGKNSDGGADNNDAPGGDAPAAGQHHGLGKSPGVWRLGTAKDFQGGKLDGVLISSRGELALAPGATSLLTSPERFFWAQATDSAGNLFVGGWLDGGVTKISTDGKSEHFFAGTGEVAVTALTCGPDGSVYAAAEPSGAIYRIAADGKGAVLCHLPDERVWAMRTVAGALYVGTGSEGHLYRVGADGKAELVFSAPDRHIYALADDGKGGIFCGTYPRGKIFHVQDGKAIPVYELPNSTVSALAVDAHGVLFVGTSPHASVVRITPSGDVSVLFQSKEKHVFSLTLDDAGNVYAGVGTPARVYRIAPDRTVSTLWAPQAAYVLSLNRDSAGNLFATTAGPTQIVRLSAAPAASGTFTSSILNASNTASWGAIRWVGSVDGIQIRTRTGNTAYPDATWSGWSDPYTAGAGQEITSPAGQYLQYQLVLTSKAGAPAPALRSLEMFYRPKNRAPEVAVKAPLGTELVAGSATIRWTGRDPDGDRLTYDIYYAPDGSSNWVKIGTKTGRSDEPDEAGDNPDEAASPGSPGATTLIFPARKLAAASIPRAVPTTSGRLTTARRAAASNGKVSGKSGTSDGNAPALLRAAPAGPPDENSDAADESPDDGNTLRWNSHKVADGWYRIKIVVSDVLSNPDEPLTAEAVSDAIHVDNTPPKILVAGALRSGPAPPLEIPVEDAGTYVASAEYRVDQGDWIAAAAADGIFDSPKEKIRIDVKRLKPGKHVLEVRARDAAGNETTVRIPYLLAGAAAPAVQKKAAATRQ